MVVAAGSPVARAQPGCDAPVTSEWLKPPPAGGIGAAVERALVRPVTHDLPRAIAMLATRASVEIAPRDVVALSGPGELPSGGLRPYLVRAVFPTAHPSLTLRWSGAGLHVAAAGLGCAPFSNHPVIVFLDRQPADVFVTASAAL